MNLWRLRVDKMVSDPDDYAKWLDSGENPLKFITPENSPTLKLLRQLQKEETKPNKVEGG